MFDLETREYFVSRDVTFCESEFPSIGNPTELASDSSSVHFDLPEQSGMADVECAPSEASNPPAEAVVPPTEAELGRGRRERAPPRHLQDYVLNVLRHSSTSYPLTDFVSYDIFSSAHRGFLASITAGVEPRSYRQAVRDLGWCDALKAEISALENNGTWSLVELPNDKKALGSRWVYKIKYKSDGSVERLKARLVAFGNHQTEGIDYSDTFAPVAKMSTIRAFLAVTAARGWVSHQMDVHNAFLHDYSLFSYVRGDRRLHVLIYVDDLIISSNNSAALSAFKDYLSSCFHMKDLGALKYVLECGLLGGRPVGFPMEPNHKLGNPSAPLSRMVNNTGDWSVASFTYLIHGLIWLMMFMYCLSSCISRNKTTGMRLSECWCDSDWASSPMTRRSIIGWIVFLSGSPISWKTKKQKTVALSSGEAEYHSLTVHTCELK
ncbi:transmembrane signal receptor [Lithospermum erythrorhizon]|uniref:Transmembrane signal receptor n=1 Tax=Lithospermum erythrorhizon TaxID=34254 RepID=A0AAV3QZE1_LITER